MRNPNGRRNFNLGKTGELLLSEIHTLLGLILLDNDFSSTYTPASKPFNLYGPSPSHSKPDFGFGKAKTDYASSSILDKEK